MRPLLLAFGATLALWGLAVGLGPMDASAPNADATMILAIVAIMVGVLCLPPAIVRG